MFIKLKSPNMRPYLSATINNFFDGLQKQWKEMQLLF